MAESAPVAMTVRLAGNLHDKLRELAAREQSSINREVNIAIRAHLDNTYRGKR